MKKIGSLVAAILLSLTVFAKDEAARLIANPKTGWVTGTRSLSAYVSLHPMGGYHEVFLFKGNVPIGYAEDVTAFFFYGNGIVYSASAIYGSKPGIYFFDSSNRFHLALLKGATNRDYQIIRVDSQRGELTYSELPIDEPDASPESHRLNYSALIHRETSNGDRKAR
jgi:hypothetical protein